MLCVIFLKICVHFVFTLPLRMTSKNNFEVVSDVQRPVFVFRAKMHVLGELHLA